MPKQLLAFCLLGAILAGCGTTREIPAQTAPAAVSKGGYQTQTLGKIGRFERMFNMLDKDDSGSLDLGEFQVLLARRSVQAKRSAHVFKRLDRSEDGKLSYAEFEPFWSKYLKAVELRHQRLR